MPTTTLHFRVPGGLRPASGGEARAEAVFKDCPTLQLAAERGVEFPVHKG